MNAMKAEKFGREAFKKGLKDNPNEDAEFIKALKEENNMATVISDLKNWHDGWRNGQIIDELGF